jgi:hypothetical protein
MGGIADICSKVNAVTVHFRTLCCLDGFDGLLRSAIHALTTAYTWPITLR